MIIIILVNASAFRYLWPRVMFESFENCRSHFIRFTIILSGCHLARCKVIRDTPLASSSLCFNGKVANYGAHVGKLRLTNFDFVVKYRFLSESSEG